MKAERKTFQFIINRDGGLQLVDGNPSLFDDNSVILVVDEENYRIWLYIGAAVSLIHKRAAMRAANSIRRFGYHLNESLIGNKCKELIVIDPETDSEQRSTAVQQLKSIINASSSTPVLEKVENASKPFNFTDLKERPLIRPIEELNKSVEHSSGKTSTLSKSLVTSLKTNSETSYRKLGVLLASILSIYPEIKISRLGEGYSVEAPSGVICKLKVKNDRLIVSASSTFGGEKIKYKIQKKFVYLVERMKPLFELK
ncbi:MAG: hypothetical protein QW327_04540 [Candidatus Odinarchaeota archaeon]